MHTSIADPVDPDDAPPPPVQAEYKWAPIPEELLYDRRISHLAVRVYGTLMRYAQMPGGCYPSHRRIAEHVGASQRSIQKPLRDLENAGWISRFVRTSSDHDGRTSDGYILHQNPQPTEGGGAHICATPAQDSADPPRKSARAPRAQIAYEREREERERSKERGTTTHTSAPPPPDPDPSKPVERASRSTAPKTKKRGSRLPDSFTLTDGMRAWAQQKGYSPGLTDREFERFTNYWISEGRVKADWGATWRNWMLKLEPDVTVTRKTRRPDDGIQYR